MDQIVKFNDFISTNTFKKLSEKVGGTGVRCRFAPSPTGPLHLGGVRTALYNYLFAKQHNGICYLRIEDTDQTRFVPGAEEYIIKSLDWCGIEFDEGPHVGGPYGPYRQSERRDIYVKYAKQLVDNGKAYYCFDTPSDIEEARKKFGPDFMYNSKTRMSMKNSLTLDKDQVDAYLSAGMTPVLRVKLPENVNIEVDDIIRGKVIMNSDTLDDKVLFKSDGLPTYHLASVVDDHLMKTTHVIRGEEWLPSAPLHVFLYDAFGWDMPEFAHLPLILKPVGNGKLSKRDGDQMGFPVFPLKWTDPNDPTNNSKGYKDSGYSPEAFINMLAFLGWNPGTEKEVYTMDELIRDFDLSRVGKSGAKFNIEKAKWFNGQHMKNVPDEELLVQLKDEMKSRGMKKYPDSFLLKMIEQNKGKVNFAKDILDVARYLFERPERFYDEKTYRKKWTEQSPEIINSLRNIYDNISNWNPTILQTETEKFVTDNNLTFNDVMPQLRLVLTGYGFGPNIFETMEMLGKDETLGRMGNYKTE